MNGITELKTYEFENKKLKELSPAQNIIYTALYSFANVKEKRFIVYPSLETIHNKTNLGITTICRHIKILVEKGWIAISKQKCKMGNYNQYTLKVLWNNTKESFVNAGEKIKETSNKFIEKVNNIIKKDKPVEVEKVEKIKDPVETVKFEGSKLVVKTEKELEEEFYRKERMDLIKRVVNPHQRLNANLIRLAEKADKEGLFMDVIFPMVDKVVEEDCPVSVLYLENAFKIALNNNKYYYKVDVNDSSYIAKQNACEDDEELIGWF